MCGFAGLFNNSFAVHRQQVDGIAGKVSFRGPDCYGIRVYNHEMQAADKGSTVLFFNRLAIIDLDARSDQPFEDERFSLQFNGEIYNYVELKKALQQEGVIFKTTSDTEVLFYALQHWGTSALSRLNGMFAFCLLDKKNKTFILARDRMGVKPLYYHQHQKQFIFSSELDSVLRLSTLIPGIEPSSVQMFLWTQFIPTPYTIAKDIFKLPPGHYIKGTWDDLENKKRLHPISFWDAYVQAGNNREKTGPEGLEAVLVNSLSRQLIADVPLGFFLSSGVDSSLLAALVSKHFSSSQQFNFFTVAFSEATTSDESNEAINYIKGFNNPALKSHTLTIDAGFIGNHLENLYNFFDEPFGDYTSLLNWVISGKAKEFVTVALSGDGADELFWGYRRYDQWKNPSLLLFDRLRVNKTLAGFIQPFLPGNYLRAKAALEMAPDPVHRFFTLFLSPVLSHLMENPVWSQSIWAMQGVEQVRNREDLVALLDLKTYLADAMLHKVDRASMAASLEVRVPYLDNTVVDYALALPLQYKSNTQFKHKAVLKQLLQQLAPHYDISQPKRGFNFPLDKWLRFEWREQALSLINKENLGALSLDDKIYLRMVQQYYAGDKKYCIAVWYLFNLVLWYQKYKKITSLQQL